MDLENPGLDPAIVARHFDSDEQALDHARVVEHLIEPSETFYILGQSYGGHVAFQYLMLGNQVRQPSGYIFSSTGLPNEDTRHFHLKRRQTQLRLNRQLERTVPNISENLNKLRNRLKEVGLAPDSVHYLWQLLGAGKTGEWEGAFERQVESLLKMTKVELSQYFEEREGQVHLLNYILSSTSNTPGYTDRTLSRLTSNELHFESWMVDENWTVNQIGLDGWQAAMIDALDSNIPPPSFQFSNEAVRERLAQTKALFTLGWGDALIPTEESLEVLESLHVNGHTKTVLLEGGHRAIFSEAGHKAIVEWAKAP